MSDATIDDLRADNAKLADRLKKTLFFANSAADGLIACQAERDRLKGRVAELAKERLLTLMRNYSEDRWSAGWYDGLEFILWRQLQSGDPATAAPLDDLRTLAAEAGGWWTWRQNMTTFVPAAEWAVLFEAHEREMSAGTEAELAERRARRSPVAGWALEGKGKS